MAPHLAAPAPPAAETRPTPLPSISPRRGTAAAGGGGGALVSPGAAALVSPPARSVRVERCIEWFARAQANSMAAINELTVAMQASSSSGEETNTEAVYNKVSWCR